MFNSRIQLKGDTQSNFETNNPLLLENELAVVKTTAGDIRFKIGDGIHNFNDLEYTDNFLVEDIVTLQNNLNLKANINSPAFTGIPTAPTADKTTSNTQIATTAFVQSLISSSSGGTTIVCSSTEPPEGTLKTGDMWYKII